MMIKKAVLEKVKKILETEKANLLSKKYNMDIDIDGDEIDEIQGKLIASINSQLSSRDVIKIASIDNALKRIEDKTFGMCEECGDQIADKRLEANPYFATCISCAEQKEMEEKQRRRF